MANSLNNFNALKLAEDQITDLDHQLLKRKLRTNQLACDTVALVDDRKLKAFCSNDYLGLANHPEITKALSEGAQKYGASSGASHLISGHSIAHEQLEKRLALFQSEHIPNAHALFFSTGYLTNLTAITGLVRLAPQGSASIYSAKLNHASLIDGVRLASIQTSTSVTLFDHTIPNSLDDQLKKMSNLSSSF
jgi:8-amino-7-oxononanoate synthase